MRMTGDDGGHETLLVERTLQCNNDPSLWELCKSRSMADAGFLHQPYMVQCCQRNLPQLPSEEAALQLGGSRPHHCTTRGLRQLLSVLVARLDLHLSRDGYSWDVLEPQSVRPLCLRLRLEALARSLIYVVLTRLEGSHWLLCVCACARIMCVCTLMVFHCVRE